MVSICQIDSGLVVKVHNWSAVGLPLTSDQISIGIHGLPWFTDENMCIKYLSTSAMGVLEKLDIKVD